MGDAHNHGGGFWCGRLEGVGRLIFSYRCVAIDEPVADGEVLPFLGGLRVVHLAVSALEDDLGRCQAVGLHLQGDRAQFAGLRAHNDERQPVIGMALLRLE